MRKTATASRRSRNIPKSMANTIAIDAGKTTLSRSFARAKFSNWPPHTTR
jgi:hypothetical protein